MKRLGLLLISTVLTYHGDSVDRFDGQTGAWKDTMGGNGLAGPVDIAFRRQVRSTEQAQ